MEPGLGSTARDVPPVSQELTAASNAMEGLRILATATASAPIDSRETERADASSTRSSVIGRDNPVIGV